MSRNSGAGEDTKDAAIEEDITNDEEEKNELELNESSMPRRQCT